MPPKPKSKSKKSKPVSSVQQRPGFAPELEVGAALARSKNAYALGMGIVAGRSFNDGVRSTAKHVNHRILTGTNPAQFYQSDEKTGVLIPMNAENVYKKYGPTLGTQINAHSHGSSYGKNMTLNGFENGLDKLRQKKHSFTFRTEDGPTTYAQNIFGDIRQKPDQMLRVLESPVYGINDQNPIKLVLQNKQKTPGVLMPSFSEIVAGTHNP